MLIVPRVARQMRRRTESGVVNDAPKGSIEDKKARRNLTRQDSNARTQIKNSKWRQRIVSVSRQCLNFFYQLVKEKNGV